MRHLLIVSLCFLTSCASFHKLNVPSSSEPEAKGSIFQIMPEPDDSEVDEAPIDRNKPVSLVLEDVDRRNVSKIIQQLKELEKNGNTKVWIKIDSFGGSIWDGFKLIQAIEAYPHPITCVADVKAMSMGFYVLQSCDVRLMTKRAILMAHSPSMETGGNANELEDAAAMLRALHEGFLAVCLEKMKISKAELIQKTVGRTWFLSWEDAVKYKAVDRIIEPRNIPLVLK